MKILLSAYACRPGKGSELGVGWQWAVALGKLGYKVVVLTRPQHKQAIEIAKRAGEVPGEVEFEYVGVSGSARGLQKGKLLLRTHYTLWQWRAYFRAKRLMERQKFDLVHHLTFGVFRHQSPLWLLGVPFVFGPVGGGEMAPIRLWWSFGAKGAIAEILRATANVIACLNPFLWLMYSRSARLITKTPDTSRWIPWPWRKRVEVLREIGVDQTEILVRTWEGWGASDGIRVLFVGRLLGWKGCLLAVEGFRLALEKGFKGTLTIIGDGPLKNKIAKAIASSGLETRIKVIPKVNQEQLFRTYKEFELLLYPSLHDSSGNVVLESLAAGIPVVCMDCGGPALMVGSQNGWLVSSRGSGRQVATRIANTLLEIEKNPDEIVAAGRRAKNWASGQSWNSIVKAFYESNSKAE